MADDIRLAVGDGDVTDDLLLDGVTGYGVRNGSFSAPYTPGDRYRIISWTEDVYGTSGDDLWQKIGALNAKLRQAQEAAGPYGRGSRVTLSMKLAGATNYVYADIVSGYVDVGQDNWTGPTLAAAYLPVVSVTLVCEPALRGAPVTTTVSGTITATTGAYATPGGAAAAGGLFLDDIPGDLPALMRHTIEDVSTSSKVINDLIIGSFSMRDPLANTYVAADFAPWIDDTPSGAGAAYADADGVGGSCSRVTLSETLQRVALYRKPSASLMTGLFDAWVRIRDSNTILGAPVLTAAGVDNDASMWIRQVTTAPITSGTTISASWGSSTRAGSTLLMAVGVKSRTITITTPTGWTASSAAIAHASANCRMAWFYIENSPSRSGTETVTISGSGVATVTLIEVVGAIHGSTSIDVEVTGSTTSVSTALTIATGTTAQAREMVFGFAQEESGTWGVASSSALQDLTAIVDDDAQDVYAQYGRMTGTTSASMSFKPNNAVSVVGGIISVRQAQDRAINLPVGTYEVCVAAADASNGTLSAPSQVATVAVTQTDCVIYLAWTPGTGTPDHYRLFYRVVGGTWEYFDSTAGAGTITAYTITDDGGTVGDPPEAMSVTLVYLLFGLSSGAQTFFTKPVEVQVGGGNFEWLYLGTVPLPPQPPGDGLAPREWIAYVEVSNSVGSGTFDADALVLLPHPIPSADNAFQVHVSFKNDDMTTLRRWNVETMRSGWTIAYLSESGTDTEAGQLAPIGECLGGPGPTWLTMIPSIAAGVSDVVDAKWTWKVTYTPRYLWPRG